ncbi:MAG: cytochrome P450 [Pseudomonadota bacterium]
MRFGSPEFFHNPYPFYADRRSQGGALQLRPNTWTLTGYHELAAVLQSPLAGRGEVGYYGQTGVNKEDFRRFKQQNPAFRLIDQWMLFKNPPEHTVVRQKIAKSMTARVFNALESSIRATLNTLLAELDTERDGLIEFSSEVAYPFPNRVIGDLLGIPPDTLKEFTQWSGKIADVVEGGYLSMSSAYRDELNQGALDLKRHFKQLRDTTDFTGRECLIEKFSSTEGGELDEDEILANCVFMLFAGMESTSFAICNMIHALLSHPDQLALLREQPSLADNAADESLRFDPPIQMLTRVALDKIETDRVTVEKGENILAFIGAAGRDPDVNHSPDDFNIERESIRHLAFTRGTHHCMGSVLARIEMRVFLEEFFGRFADVRHFSEPVRRKNWLMRGFESLPLRCTH